MVSDPERTGLLRLTPRERPAFWATFMGWGLDGFDYMLYTLVLATLLTVFKLTDAQGGLLGTVTLAVSALGGVIAGTVADRVGRVRTLAAAIILYSVFTFLSGLATSYGMLLVFRGFEGLGFGGEWAVGSVLVAETVAARYRGRLLGLVQGSWAIGWGIAVIASFVILPNLGGLGWRAMFWIGILPAILVFYVLRRVEEPAVWRERRQEAATGVSFFRLFNRNVLRTTVFTSILAVGAQSGYYAIFTWLPTYLKVDRGLSVIGSGPYLLLIILGSFIGYILSGYITDALGRKLNFAIFSICSGVVILIYTHFQISNGAMLALSVPLGFFASGIFSGFGPYLAELFPTSARGAGQGFAYNFGRGAAAFAPLIVGSMAGTYGLAGAISVFGPATYLLCIIALLFLPETKGRELNASAVTNSARA